MRHALMLALLLCSVPALATDADRDSLSPGNVPLRTIAIAEAQLAPYREDPDYDYRTKAAKRTVWDDMKTWLRTRMWRLLNWTFGPTRGQGILGFLIQMLPYLLVGILVFILIRFFSRFQFGDPWRFAKKDTRVGLAADERPIKNEDLYALLQEALAGGDHRLALRYYYLYLLRRMAQLQLIDRQLQKTNHEYIDELKSPELKGPFRALTHLYDHVWYGGYPLDGTGYQKAARMFADLERTLDRHA